MLPDTLTEGDVFTMCDTSVKEGETTPPKHYTEDSLLSAMETAGAKDMPEDAERKGLGTPATRAGIIEKLIETGLVERKKNKKLGIRVSIETYMPASLCHFWGTDYLYLEV